MSRKYKNLLPLKINNEAGQGDIFEADLDAEQERENVKSGLIEIQPQTYKVIGDSDVYETPPGETFEKALPLGEEQLLVDGGFVELVEDKPAPPEPPAKKPSSRKKKED